MKQAFCTLILLGSASLAAIAASPRAPEPIACDVRRAGGCFDLTIDGQEVGQLDTPDGKALDRGGDYLRHTRTSRLWFVSEPVSARPKIVLSPNDKTVQWLEGTTCIDVIIEQANPMTFHARRFAIAEGEGSCNQQALTLHAEGRELVTGSTESSFAPLPPGDYVAFVRAYGSVHGWDMKTLFFTVGDR